MDTKLLSNKELENYSVEDSFDFLVKADAIKIFLEHNAKHLDKNKMLVLYGDWGSGKTSLMKHIESEIDKKTYFPIFFHAWQHEKDENLPLSLCDALVNSVNDNSEIVKDFMKGALLALRGFTSGVTLKAPGFLTGLGLDFEFSGEKYIKAIDEALKDSKTPSFYKSNTDFKDNFRKIEDLILKKSGAKKILIFVDDLDRCEPENVLNLITALKLFFTYGDKTVYFCGIDKEAVTKAVKTKYKDVVKSEEYMEKVFDIAFNMPKTFSLKKILEPHFFDIQVNAHDGHTYLSIDLIEDFFKSIGFTNPRHLKKILNKYEIIKSFKSLGTLPAEIRALIPNILVDDNTGSIFETIYCLFVIILYEFNFDEFEKVENYENKMLQYTEIMYQTNLRKNPNYAKSSAITDLYSTFYIKDIQKQTFSTIYNYQMNPNNPNSSNTYGFGRFLIIFSNNNPSFIQPLRNAALTDYNQFFIDNTISTNFCKFLIRNNSLVVQEGLESYYKLWNLFNMVKYLL